MPAPRNMYDPLVEEDVAAATAAAAPPSQQALPRSAQEFVANIRARGMQITNDTFNRMQQHQQVMGEQQAQQAAQQQQLMDQFAPAQAEQPPGEGEDDDLSWAKKRNAELSASWVERYASAPLSRGASSVAAMPDMVTGDTEEYAQHMRDIRNTVQYTDEDKALVAKATAPKTSISEMLGIYASNPRLIVGMAAESLPMMAAPLIGALMGSAAGSAVAGPAGTLVGGGVGGFGGSFAVNYESKLQEAMNESGLDVTNPDDIARFYSDPKMYKAFRGKAALYGIPVAVMDTFSLGMAGRVMKLAEKSGLAKKALALVADTAIQGAAGMAGEAGGQLASEGKITSKHDIMAEGLLEGAFGAVEAAASPIGAAYRMATKDRKPSGSIRPDQFQRVEPTIDGKRVGDPGVDPGVEAGINANRPPGQPGTPAQQTAQTASTARQRASATVEEQKRAAAEAAGTTGGPPGAPPTAPAGAGGAPAGAPGTPVAGMPPNAPTTPEAPQDLQAQFDEMLDEETGRKAIYVGAANADQVQALIDSTMGTVIPIRDETGGFLLTTDPAVADQYIRLGRTEAARGAILGYAQPKETVDPNTGVVVERTNAEGASVSNQVVSPELAPNAVAAEEAAAKEGETVETKHPLVAQMDRAIRGQLDEYDAATSLQSKSGKPSRQRRKPKAGPLSTWIAGAASIVKDAAKLGYGAGDQAWLDGLNEDLKQAEGVLRAHLAKTEEGAGAVGGKPRGARGVNVTVDAMLQLAAKLQARLTALAEGRVPRGGAAPALGEQVREMSLETQRQAGWNTDWPFVPIDLAAADFRQHIANDPTLSAAEKNQIFEAGKKLGVVPQDEKPAAEIAKLEKLRAAHAAAWEAENAGERDSKTFIMHERSIAAIDERIKELRRQAAPAPAPAPVPAHAPKQGFARTDTGFTHNGITYSFTTENVIVRRGDESVSVLKDRQAQNRGQLRGNEFAFADAVKQGIIPRDIAQHFDAWNKTSRSGGLEVTEGVEKAAAAPAPAPTPKPTPAPSPAPSPTGKSTKQIDDAKYDLAMAWKARREGPLKERAAAQEAVNKAQAHLNSLRNAQFLRGEITKEELARLRESDAKEEIVVMDDTGVVARGTPEPTPTATKGETAKETAGERERRYSIIGQSGKAVRHGLRQIAHDEKTGHRMFLSESGEERITVYGSSDVTPSGRAVYAGDVISTRGEGERPVGKKAVVRESKSSEARTAARGRKRETKEKEERATTEKAAGAAAARGTAVGDAEKGELVLHARPAEGIYTTLLEAADGEALPEVGSEEYPDARAVEKYAKGRIGELLGGLPSLGLVGHLFAKFRYANRATMSETDAKKLESRRTPEQAKAFEDIVGWSKLLLSQISTVRKGASKQLTHLMNDFPGGSWPQAARDEWLGFYERLAPSVQATHERLRAERAGEPIEEDAEEETPLRMSDTYEEERHLDDRVSATSAAEDAALERAQTEREYESPETELARLIAEQEQERDGSEGGNVEDPFAGEPLDDSEAWDWEHHSVARVQHSAANLLSGRAEAIKKAFDEYTGLNPFIHRLKALIERGNKGLRGGVILSDTLTGIERQIARLTGTRPTLFPVRYTSEEGKRLGANRAQDALLTIFKGSPWFADLDIASVNNAEELNKLLAEHANKLEALLPYRHGRLRDIAERFGWTSRGKKYMDRFTTPEARDYVHPIRDVQAAIHEYIDDPEAGLETLFDHMTTGSDAITPNGFAEFHGYDRQVARLIELAYVLQQIKDAPMGVALTQHVQGTSPELLREVLASYKNGNRESVGAFVSKVNREFTKDNLGYLRKRMTKDGAYATDYNNGTWVFIPQGSQKENVELLRKLSNANWCTSRGQAEDYLLSGDFYILIDENNRAQAGLSWSPSSLEVRELRGPADDHSFSKKSMAALDELAAANPVMRSRIIRYNKRHQVQTVEAADPSRSIHDQLAGVGAETNEDGYTLNDNEPDLVKDLLSVNAWHELRNNLTVIANTNPELRLPYGKDSAGVSMGYPRLREIIGPTLGIVVSGERPRVTFPNLQRVGAIRIYLHDDANRAVFRFPALTHNRQIRVDGYAKTMHFDFPNLVLNRAQVRINGHVGEVVYNGIVGRRLFTEMPGQHKGITTDPGVLKKAAFEAVAVADDSAGKVFRGTFAPNLPKAVQSVASNDPSRDYNITGVYDPVSGIMGIVGDMIAFNEMVAHFEEPNKRAERYYRAIQAVLAHEVLHATEDPVLVDAANDLMKRREQTSGPLRELLDAVQERISDAQVPSQFERNEVVPYIIEEVFARGLKAHFDTVGIEFMEWVENNFGKQMRSLLDAFINKLRALAGFFGWPGNKDELLIADIIESFEIGMERAEQGDVVERVGTATKMAASKRNVTKGKAQGKTNTGRLVGILGPGIYNSDVINTGIKEVFQNAFDAVRDARTLGRIVLGTGRIEVTTNRDENYIEIKDNGIGMFKDTVNNAFLTIAGTEKHSERSSGGFGIAKVAFLYANERITLHTVRDGRYVAFDATGNQIIDMIENEVPLDTEEGETDEPNGTTVRVYYPKELTDPATGVVTTPHMPTEPWQMESIVKSPLFEPIDVIVNKQLALDTGRPFMDRNMDGLVPHARIKFRWGEANIYMRPRGSAFGDNLSILVNGLWQFSKSIVKNPMEAGSEVIPYNFVVDLDPSVKAENPLYPFALNRQGFKDPMKPDLEALMKYLRAVWRRGDTADVAASYGDLRIVDPTTGFGETLPLREATHEEIDPFKLEGKGQTSIIDGKIIIGTTEVAQLSRDEMLSQGPLGIDAHVIAGVGRDSTLLHDGLLIQPEPMGQTVMPAYRYARPSERALAAKRARDVGYVSAHEYLLARFGDSYTRMVLEISTQFRQLRDAVFNHDLGAIPSVKQEVDEGVPHAVGVSLAPLNPDHGGYLGVNIKVPVRAAFINLMALSHREFAKPIFAAQQAYVTMLHEIVHFYRMNHDTTFIYKKDDIEARIYEILDIDEWLYEMGRVFRQYEHIFKFMRELDNAQRLTSSALSVDKLGEAARRSGGPADNVRHDDPAGGTGAGGPGTRAAAEGGAGGRGAGEQPPGSTTATSGPVRPAPVEPPPPPLPPNQPPSGSADANRRMGSMLRYVAPGNSERPLSPKLLGMMLNDYLLEYGLRLVRHMPLGRAIVQQYIETYRAKQHDARTMQQTAEVVIRDARQLHDDDPDMADRVAALALETTTHDISPDKSFEDHKHFAGIDEAREVYDRIRAMFDQLSGPARRVYLAMRDHYAEMREALLRAQLHATFERRGLSDKLIRGRAVRQQLVETLIRGVTPEQRQATIDAAWAQMRVVGDPPAGTLEIVNDIMEETSVLGDYFPITRHGRHVVEGEKEGELEIDFEEGDTPEFKRALVGEVIKADKIRNPGRKYGGVRISGGSGTVQYTDTAVYMPDTKKQAKAYQEKLRREGYEVRPFITRKQTATPVSKAALEELLGYMAGEDASPDQLGAVRTAHIKLLSDANIRKSDLARHRIRGGENDFANMMKTFAERSYSGAWSLATLKHIVDEQEALAGLNRLQKDAYAGQRIRGIDYNAVGDFVEELKARRIQEAAIHQNSGTWARVQSFATRAAFVWYLGSVSHALANATQIALVSLPIIGGEHGLVRTGMKLTAVSGRFTMPAIKRMMGALSDAVSLNVVRLDDAFEAILDASSAAQPVRDMLKELVRRGVIDTMMVTELARVVYTNTSQNPTFRKVAKVSDYIESVAKVLPQLTEIMNRIVTATAAYELSLERSRTSDATAKHNEAVDYAERMTRQTQGNYAVENQPRYLRAIPGFRLIGLYKTFGMLMYGLTLHVAGSTLRASASPQERANARKASIYFAAVNGIALGAVGGLMVEPVRFVAWLASLALQGLGWDDDEDEDKRKLAFYLRNPDLAARQMFADWAGEEGGLWLSDGVLSGATGIEWGQRVGFGHLLWQPLQPSKDANEWLGRMVASGLGPVAGLFVKGANAFEQMQTGNQYRMWEYLLPKGAGDLLRARRLMEGGKGIEDSAGVPLMEAKEASGADVVKQSIGFTPEKVQRRYAERTMQRTAEDIITGGKEDLMTEWARLVQDGDYAAADRLRRGRIAQFNRAHTHPKSRIKPSDLQRKRISQRREERKRRRGEFSDLPEARSLAK